MKFQTSPIVSNFSTSVNFDRNADSEAYFLIESLKIVQFFNPPAFLQYAESQIGNNCCSKNLAFRSTTSSNKKKKTKFAKKVQNSQKFVGKMLLSLPFVVRYRWQYVPVRFAKRRP